MKNTVIATPPQPLRTARQQRSRLLVQSVREATLQLLRNPDAGEITTVRIAERAGISIGSLYRYYPNKEAILTDIYEQQLSLLDERLRARQRPDSSCDALEVLIQEGVMLTVGFHRELLALNTAFFSAFRRNFSIIERQGPGDIASWQDWSVLWLTDVLRNNRHRLKKSVTDLGATARLLIDMTYGTLGRVIETRPQDLHDDTVIEQLQQLIFGYLLERPDESSFNGLARTT